MLFLYNEFSSVVHRLRLARERLFGAVKADGEMAEGDVKWKITLTLKVFS